MIVALFNPQTFFFLFNHFFFFGMVPLFFFFGTHNASIVSFIEIYITYKS